MDNFPHALWLVCYYPIGYFQNTCYLALLPTIEAFGIKTSVDFVHLFDCVAMAQRITITNKPNQINQAIWKVIGGSSPNIICGYVDRFKFNFGII